jgi:hypothetical protein
MVYTLVCDCYNVYMCVECNIALAAKAVSEMNRILSGK